MTEVEEDWQAALHQGRCMADGFVGPGVETTLTEVRMQSPEVLTFTCGELTSSKHGADSYYASPA